jgi:hypothetical protein
MLDGLSRDKSKDLFSIFLIGELGRNEKNINTDLPGDYILQIAIDLISEVHEIIGGRAVLVECNDNPELRKYYTNNGFTLLQIKPESSTGHPLLQYIRKIAR